MLNIIPQVLDKIRIRVVRHDYIPRAVDGRDETGETGAGTELEDGFVFQEGIRVLLEVGGDGAAGVPEVVALVVYLVNVGWEDMASGVLVLGDVTFAAGHLKKEIFARGKNHRIGSESLAARKSYPQRVVAD